MCKALLKRLSQTKKDDINVTLAKCFTEFGGVGNVAESVEAEHILNCPHAGERIGCNFCHALLAANECNSTIQMSKSLANRLQVVFGRHATSPPPIEHAHRNLCSNSVDVDVVDLLEY
jgi:hypothetical protein